MHRNPRILGIGQAHGGQTGPGLNHGLLGQLDLGEKAVDQSPVDFLAGKAGAQRAADQGRTPARDDDGHLGRRAFGQQAFLGIPTGMRQRLQLPGLQPLALGL